MKIFTIRKITKKRSLSPHPKNSLPGKQFPSKICHGRAVQCATPSNNPAPGGKTAALNGSMTVECALVLPFFMIAMFTVMFIMDAISTQTSKNIELSNKARKAAMTAGFVTDGAGSWADINIPLRFEFPYTVIPGYRLYLSTRARVHTWTGNDGLLERYSSSGADSGQAVFVTNNKSVYHTHSDCTHLDLSVTAVSSQTVSSLRNEYGERYKPCEGFPAGYSGTVYITSKGDRYYPSADHTGLKRDVYITDKNSVSGLPECERCAARDAALSRE